jgi:hypothetical protein
MLPSPDGTGARGRDAPVKELKVINVAWAPARFLGRLMSGTNRALL